MRKMLALTAAVSLAGCDVPAFNLPIMAVKPSAYHTVSYYDSHPLERDQTNAWCGDNPGLATRVPTCGNADQSGINTFNHKMGWR